jgi:hypothetical protein
LQRTGQAAPAAHGVHVKMDLLDINRRGDENFAALTGLEKDLYVLLLFDALHVMEGISHFFAHHLERVPRLLAFLKACDAPNRAAIQDLVAFLREKVGGTWNPAAVDKCFFEGTVEDNLKIDAWERAYYSQVPEMWEQVRRYAFDKFGVELN